MNSRLSRYSLLAFAAGALVLPGAAQAATKDVYAGTPPKGLLKGVPEFAVDNSFYPKRIAVRAGDKVSFKIVGFHNVLFAPKGTTPPALFVPNPAAPVSGVKDAAGADFWFNGQPSLAPNPQVLGPTGGKTIDGSKLVGSGLAVAGPPKPFVVKFPKKGSYKILCSIHPGMSATVTVKGRNADVPGKKQIAKRVKAQKKAAAKLAKKLVAGDGVPAGNVVIAGNDRKGVATLAFFPGTKSVKVGESVEFRLSKKTTEIHNVAFAPEDYAKQLAQTFLGPAGVDPITAYPSQPFGTPLVADGVVHGNGYVNSGVLDVESASPQADKSTVTFTKAGTYAYYCIVHGAEMKGTITVTD